MRCIALVSGGLDSPVAAYLVMRCGVDVIPLVMDNGSFSKESVGRAPTMMKILKKHLGGNFHYFISSHGKNLEEFVLSYPRKLTCIFCKKTMLRVACRVAERKGVEAVLTGETLGSKASQTLHNLGILSQASTLPVLRPMLALNKKEVVRTAIEIGTDEISSGGGERCKAVPEFPSTKACLEEVVEAERGIDALADEVIENARGVNP